MGPEDPARRAVVPLGLSLTLPLGNYLTSGVGNYLTRSALKLGLCVTFDIDDADLQVPLLAQLLTRVAGRPADAPRVRLLLLARHTDGWWDQLNRQTNDLTGGQLDPDARRDQYKAAAAFGQLRRHRAGGPPLAPEPAGTHSVLAARD